MKPCLFRLSLLFVSLFVGGTRPINAQVPKDQDRMSIEVQIGYEPKSYSDGTFVSLHKNFNVRFERLSRPFKMEAQLQVGENVYVVVRAGLGFNHKGWEFWGYPICMRGGPTGYQTPFSLEAGRRFFSLNLWLYRDKAVPSVSFRIPLKGY